MTSHYYAHEDDWTDEEWAYAADIPTGDGVTIPVDLGVFIGFFLLVALLVWGALQLSSGSVAVVVDQAPVERENGDKSTAGRPIALPLNDPTAFISPYDVYVVTQGIHGQSYGHMAVDIAAGKGEPIKSPINGMISDNFIDGIGNTTLVIENERYAVTMLHGIYGVEVGDKVEIGQKIGVESNIGNTRDMQGNSCRNRDCGYHMHLNVFDKDVGTNINPLEIIGE